MTDTRTQLPESVRQKIKKDAEDACPINLGAKDWFDGYEDGATIEATKAQVLIEALEHVSRCLIGDPYYDHIRAEIKISIDEYNQQP